VKDTNSLFALRFSIVFSAVSFLVSLLSWGRGGGLGTFPDASPVLLLHMAIHAFYGAVAALPTRRRGPIIAMAVSAMMIDVDHVAYYLGWPVPPRTSHSLFFLFLAPMVMALAARMSLLGHKTSPRMAAGMALGIILAHLAWDALTGGDARVPFWLPISARQVPLPSTLGATLELAAVSLIWFAATAEQARTRWRAATPVVEDLAGDP